MEVSGKLLSLVCDTQTRQFQYFPWDWPVTRHMSLVTCHTLCRCHIFGAQLARGQGAPHPTDNICTLIVFCYNLWPQHFIIRGMHSVLVDAAALFSFQLINMWPSLTWRDSDALFVYLPAQCLVNTKYILVSVSRPGGAGPGDLRGHSVTRSSSGWYTRARRPPSLCPQQHGAIVRPVITTIKYTTISVLCNTFLSIKLFDVYTCARGLTASLYAHVQYSVAWTWSRSTHCRVVCGPGPGETPQILMIRQHPLSPGQYTRLAVSPSLWKLSHTYLVKLVYPHFHIYPLRNSRIYIYLMEWCDWF